MALFAAAEGIATVMLVEEQLVTDGDSWYATATTGQAPVPVSVRLVPVIVIVCVLPLTAVWLDTLEIVGAPETGTLHEDGADVSVGDQGGVATIKLNSFVTLFDGSCPILAAACHVSTGE